MTTTKVELVLPDADGYLPNGWVNPYPHEDFDRPCTGQCCEPDAYPQPLAWYCENPECRQVNGSNSPAKLHQPGECVNCTPSDPSAN